MDRIPEPELMDEAEQIRAYAEADFEEPHSRFVRLFEECFPDSGLEGLVLDLGCGPGDISRRFARAHPDCRIVGVDGAEGMLSMARQLTRAAGLEERVSFIRSHLPSPRGTLPAGNAIISNSLLHHLADAQILWNSVLEHSRPGAPVLVMDLRRPGSPAEAAALMERYSGGAPAVLQRDFFHSLCAAYRPGEIRAQLREAGLAAFRVLEIGDRHQVVWGRVGEQNRPEAPATEPAFPERS